MPPSSPEKVLLSWTIESSNTTGQIMLDASINEQHTVTAEITQHRVEKSPNISDHIRSLPRSLTLEGLITNTPLDLPSTQADGVSGSIQDITATINGKTIKYRAFQFDGNLDRVRECFGDIVDAIQAGALFTITTTLKRYENFAVRNFAVPRDVQKGNALHFTIDWQEIIIVETETVAALPPKAQPKKKGAKSGKQLDPKTDQKKISVVKNLIGFMKNSGLL